MIKCKQAMENSACGKDCCCLECEEKETCKDVCSDLSPDCGDAVTEETAPCHDEAGSGGCYQGYCRPDFAEEADRGSGKVNA